MVFGMQADFLFGFYQGRNRFGAMERYPSFLRVFSALVGSSHALARMGDSTEESTDAEMYEWLENHAPDAVSLPPSMMNLGGDARAFLHKGWGQSAVVGSPDKPAASERAVRHSALSGPIIWWWREDPETSVLDHLRDCCGEVPYLGETSSPVRLSLLDRVEIPADALRRADSGIASSDAYSFDCPAPGRAKSLQKAYEALTSVRVPTASVDMARMSGQGETDRSDPWVSDCVKREVTYVLPHAVQTAYDPWSIGYLVRVRPVRPRGLQYWRPAVTERVAWTESLHRAIVKQLGEDAPAMITGHYPPGEQLPANRLTIQIIDSCMPVSEPLRDLLGPESADQSAFLVAAPGYEQGTSSEEINCLENALHCISVIALRSAKVLEVVGVDFIDATDVWEETKPGMCRWWFPHPLVIAENRTPNRKALDGRDWTIDDALRTSVGNVFRDDPDLSVSTRGDRRLVDLSAKVHSIGVRIGGSHRAYPNQIVRYIHKMNENAVIIAMQGIIHLGSLSTRGSALIAIGQSRHFGGGLLIPCDLPDLPAHEEGKKDD